MALIKSSQLVKKGTAVVAGDTIKTADLETVIPQTPDPAPSAPADRGGVGLGVDMGQAVAPETPADPELEATVPASDPEEAGDAASDGHAEGFEEGDASDPSDAAEPQEEASEEPSLVDDFDSSRDALLSEAAGAAEATLQEVQAGFGDAVEQETASLMGEAQAALQEAYGPESPEAQAGLEAVGGFVERAAQASARRNAILEISAGRWQQAASAEEQIALLLDNYHARLAEDPPPEDQVLALLAEREAILGEARLQAERLVQEAQAQAATIVQEAEGNAARTLLEVETRRQEILDELKQQGYSEGYQEGRAQADEEGAKIINEATESLDRMAGALRQAVAENEDKILRLAIGIAEKIIQDEIATRPETVMKTLDEALTKVSDLEEVIVKVNPEDLPMVQTQEEAFRDRLKSVRRVEFTSSPKIQRGGVLIETGSGTVDAQIKTQLSVIQEAFEFVRMEYADAPLETTSESGE